MTDVKTRVPLTFMRNGHRVAELAATPEEVTAELHAALAQGRWARFEPMPDFGGLPRHTFDPAIAMVRTVAA